MKAFKSICLMAAILLLAGGPVFAWQSLVVKKDGCDDSTGNPSYCTIKAALDAAEDGDEIIIEDDSTYAEGMIYVDKEVTIHSPNYAWQDPPTIKGTFDIGAANVTLRRMNIKTSWGGVIIGGNSDNATIEDIRFSPGFFFLGFRCGGMCGIFNQGGDNLVCKNNDVNGYSLGILSIASGDTIEDCNIYNCDIGMWLAFAINNEVVRDCNVYGNVYGIAYTGMGPIAIENNLVYDNAIGVYLGRGGSRTSGHKIKNNYIYNNYDNSVSDTGGIIWDNCDKMEIRYNHIYGNQNGILGSKGRENFINENNIYDNNNYGVSYDNGGDPCYWDPVIEAVYNWWGDSTGPTHSTNPTGTGDKVSDDVVYVPWSPEIYTTFSYTPTVFEPQCGDREHPHPPFDLTGPLGEPDCIVNFYDFSKIADSWLQCTALECEP